MPKRPNSRYVATLRHIAASKRRRQRTLLQQANPGVLKLIAECCLNFCRGGFRLPPAKIRKLRRYRHVIRELANRKTTSKRRKQLILQKGGFLSLLLPGAVSLLGSLLGGR